MSDGKCCEVKITDNNQGKKVFPNQTVAFCNQVQAFPVGQRVC